MKRILPYPSAPAEGPVGDDDLSMGGLLAEALAETSPSPLSPARDRALRSRLLGRVARSAEAHRGLLTARERHARWSDLAPGAHERLLFASATGPGDMPMSLRPGQPLQASIIRLDAGAELAASFDDAGLQREWLLLGGDLQLSAPDIGSLVLKPLDYHVAPSGCAPRLLRSLGGAVFYNRRAPASLEAPRGRASAQTASEAPASWQDAGGGISRRLLWREGAEAAYLIRAERGASVPGHGHAHDEECLMLDGDLFLGDVLLQPGDYQLAPAGLRHGDHHTDTGLTLLVRGDAEMRFDL